MSLIALFVLTLIVHTVDTSAYAARLAGARTGRPALANSLYNVLGLSARIANALAAPLLSSLTDQSAALGDTAPLLATYRWLILAASGGTLLAALLLPSLSRILAAGVVSYQYRRSLPRVVIRNASVRGLWKIQQHLTQPHPGKLLDSRHSPFPPSFLIANLLVIAVFTVGNFSALYASILTPAGARTALSLAPLFTGLGVILNYLWIEPLAALITDAGMRGERPLRDVTYITVWQIGARFAGTLFSQLLLVPLGGLMAGLASWLIR